LAHKEHGRREGEEEKRREEKKEQNVQTCNLCLKNEREKR
jgi:hypothetical protein